MTRGAHIRRGQKKADYYRERLFWGKCLVRCGFYRGLGAKSVPPGLGRVTRRCDGDGAGRDRANERLQRDGRRVQTAS